MNVLTQTPMKKRDTQQSLFKYKNQLVSLFRLMV